MKTSSKTRAMVQFVQFIVVALLGWFFGMQTLDRPIVGYLGLAAVIFGSGWLADWMLSRRRRKPVECADKKQNPENGS